MNFGANMQYLRMMHRNMTQEELAHQLGVSRQSISKWERNHGNPELSKIQEICALFNCSSDDLLFKDMKIVSASFSEIAIETIEAFRYIKYTVVSANPEDDAIHRIRRLAKELNVANPEIIGWDFPSVSQEQINVHHMHGYTAALVLPEGCDPKGNALVVESRETQDYVTMTIRNPMENPFPLISNAYQSVFQFIRFNRYAYDHFAYENTFVKGQTEFMKICVAIQ